MDGQGRGDGTEVPVMNRECSSAGQRFRVCFLGADAQFVGFWCGDIGRRVRPGHEKRWSCHHLALPPSDFRCLHCGTLEESELFGHASNSGRNIHKGRGGGSKDCQT